MSKGKSFWTEKFANFPWFNTNSSIYMRSLLKIDKFDWLTKRQISLFAGVASNLLTLENLSSWRISNRLSYFPVALQPAYFSSISRSLYASFLYRNSSSWKFSSWWKFIPCIVYICKMGFNILTKIWYSYQRFNRSSYA